MSQTTLVITRPGFCFNFQAQDEHHQDIQDIDEPTRFKSERCDGLPNDVCDIHSDIHSDG